MFGKGLNSKMKEIIKKILKLVPNALKNFLYGEIKVELKDIKTDLKNTTKEFNSAEKDRLRYEILAFASSLRRGEHHTTQEFETIFHFHDKYEKLIEKLNESNGYCHEEFEYIRKCYNEMQQLR